MINLYELNEVSIKEIFTKWKSEGDESGEFIVEEAVQYFLELLEPYKVSEKEDI